jgi:hypothetical protein
MPYSMDELLKLNQLYHAYHRLLQADVDKVNRLVAHIEESRQCDPTPMDGDRIICISLTEGEVSTRGYLEKRHGRLSVCVQPSVIFLYEGNGGSLYTNAGGGSWFNLSEEQFLLQAAYVGKVRTSMHVWGHGGACADGTVQFQAEVFQWKLTDSRFYQQQP